MDLPSLEKQQQVFLREGKKIPYGHQKSIEDFQNLQNFNNRKQDTSTFSPNKTINQFKTNKDAFSLSKIGSISLKLTEFQQGNRALTTAAALQACSKNEVSQNIKKTSTIQNAFQLNPKPSHLSVSVASSRLSSEEHSFETNESYYSSPPRNNKISAFSGFQYPSVSQHQEQLEKFSEDPIMLPSIRKNPHPFGVPSPQVKNSSAKTSLNGTSSSFNMSQQQQQQLYLQKQLSSQDAKMHMRSTSMNSFLSSNFKNIPANTSDANNQMNKQSPIIMNQQNDLSLKKTTSNGGFLSKARTLVVGNQTNSKQVGFSLSQSPAKDKEGILKKFIEISATKELSPNQAITYPNISSISCNHLSLRNIDTPDDLKLSGLSDSSKKIIPLSTSNALLPKSIVSHVKTLKSSSRQIIIPDSQKELEFQQDQDTLIEEQFQQESNQNLFKEDTVDRFFTETTSHNRKNIKKLNSLEEQNYHEEFGIDSPLLTSISKPQKYEQFASFQPTQEQLQFQSQFLQKIRNKIQNTPSPNSTYASFRLTKANNQTSQNQTLQNPSQLSFSLQDEMTIFKKIFSAELKNKQSLLLQSINFFLPELGVEVFSFCVLFIFQNALKILQSPGSESESKSFSFKIPEKLFHQCLHLFQVHILEDRLNFPWEFQTKFHLFAYAHYEKLELKPNNLFENIGGSKRCTIIINDVRQALKKSFPKIELISEKLFQEIGMSVLFEDQGVIDSQISDLKKQFRIDEEDFSKLKHTLFNYFFGEKDRLLDNELKTQVMRQLEIVRFRQCNSFHALDITLLQKDLFNYVKAQKLLLEYFDETDRINKVTMFVNQLAECQLYKLRPSSVAYWLKLHTFKPLDEIFFMTLKPLLIEPLSRRNISPAQLKITKLKLFWIQQFCDVSFDAHQLIQKLPELLSNMRNWIQGMIASNQLNETQLKNKQIDINNLDFLRYLIISTLSEDSFSFEDIHFIMVAFRTSKEVVQFQLKGLKRILLLMHFKPKDAYEIAEFFQNTFSECFFSPGMTKLNHQ